MTSARFNLNGDKVTVTFSRPTLRGAPPTDANGDGLPDYIDRRKTFTGLWDCSQVFIDATIAKIGAYPVTKCEWISDTVLEISFGASRTATRPDLYDQLCAKGAVVYDECCLKMPNPCGACPFVYGCTDVIGPSPVVSPTIKVTGDSSICYPAPIYVDATESENVGGKPKFQWSMAKLSGSGNPRDLQDDPERTFDMDKISALRRTLNLATRGDDLILAIPLSEIEVDTVYTVRLAVTSQWGRTAEQLLELKVQNCGISQESTTQRDNLNANFYVLGGGGGTTYKPSTTLRRYPVVVGWASSRCAPAASLAVFGALCATFL